MKKFVLFFVVTLLLLFLPGCTGALERYRPPTDKPLAHLMIKDGGGWIKHGSISRVNGIVTSVLSSTRDVYLEKGSHTVTVLYRGTFKTLFVDIDEIRDYYIVFTETGPNKTTVSIEKFGGMESILK